MADEIFSYQDRNECENCIILKAKWNGVEGQYRVLERQCRAMKDRVYNLE